MKLENNVLYTVGHSNLSIQEFIKLLKNHGVNLVLDVRSNPRSKVNPQFRWDGLEIGLNRAEIGYSFLGKELGARPPESKYYRDGKVNYSELAKSKRFNRGLELVCKLIKTNNAALMCSEGDPIKCHRSILISKNIKKIGVKIRHILPLGMIETHDELELRLLKLYNFKKTFFATNDILLEEACKLQGNRISYSKPKLSTKSILLEEVTA